MRNETRSKKQYKSSPIFEKLKIFSHSLDNRNKSTHLEFFESNKTIDSAQTSPLISETNNHLNNLTNENSTHYSDVVNKSPNTKSTGLQTAEVKDYSSVIPSKLEGYSKIQELKLVKIGLASSDKIVQWAEKILPNGKIFGEVLNANTLHYKTFKPHKGGLFCERIFGPLKDFECACGTKQKPFDGESHNVQNILEPKQSKRLFCTTCDVEYTWSVIRRYQLGYIRLISPVSHLWYLRANPSSLSLLLDIRKRDLESIIYCMQITTLEYYWRPIYLLQMNLTPSNLLNSYKQVLKMHENSENKKKFLKTLFNKKKKQLQKRKNILISRKEFFSSYSSLEKIKSLEHESLETKIQYLEKSFQLSCDEVYASKIAETSKLINFFQKKSFKKLQKKTFFTLYKKLFQEFYKELYSLNSQRSSLCLKKITKDSSNSYLNLYLINKYSLFQNKCVKIQNTKFFWNLVLKTYLQKNFVKKQKYVVNQLPYLNAQTSIWENKTKEFSKNHSKEKMVSKDYSKEKTDFINNFLELLRKTQIQRSWKSIYKKPQRYIAFLNHHHNPNRFKTLRLSWKDSSLTRILQQTFFLYILSFIQEKQEFFLKSKPIDFKNLCLLNKIFIKSEWTSTSLKKSSLQIQKKLQFFENSRNIRLLLGNTKKFEFSSQFLKPTYLFLKDRKFLNEVENVEDVSKNLKNNLFQVINIWLNKVTSSFIKIAYSSSLKKYFKKNRKQVEVFLAKKSLNSTLSTNQKFKNFYSLKNLPESISFKKTKQVNKLLFKKLNQQKKFFQFLKNDENSQSNYVLYKKNFLQISKKLVFSNKQKTLPSSLNLFNNIYTIAYSSGWETEKDWKYFLYYNTAPIEIYDKLLYCYKYRFMSNSLFNPSFSTNIPIIGANLIQKILYQYEGFELKKMAKQHQNLLPKFNRYIRNLKQIAHKKSEFLEIQKLLQKRDQIIRRLKLLRKLFKKNSQVSSVILNTLPVLPPDLRPILKMQNQIAASDLNRFYQRVLYRNERLKKFLRANSSLINYEPGFEVKYTQRLLQEAVDNLIQNGKGHVKPETNSRGQPLKSLSEILKGKQGRFRQYLLGKRVDYSGRSVIVVGPRLKIYECGLPFEMALELFLPFLIKRIFQYRLARTVVGAKMILKTQKNITWNLLEEVLQNHPILLNRAPTLHRLGIQAFQPKLIEGRAILLHPLVCSAFNADFDGDQMAVHLPITVEARTEAWKLMFSRNHLISPATGDPMLLPSQDMVLGCYYLTTESLQNARFHRGRPFLAATSFYFSNMQQVLQAYLQERIHLQTPIWMKWTSSGLMEMDPHFSQPLEIRLDSDGVLTEFHPRTQKRLNVNGVCEAFFVRTTAGRVLFNTIIENCIKN
uniref:DNA-directed RNA polymerase subunit beta' n=1 Tax=Kirchneriella aperta TaxID=117505 RepID=A0A140H9Z3_9CHLO|nr:beta subunit of RNA polymerase [Kirchneriella aperta]AMO00992.1 beta subunit of RNA polymerase [Kirchneriella aperta]